MAWFRGKKRSFENPQVPVSEAFESFLMSAPVEAGVSVNAQTPHSLPTAMACIGVIADSMSTLPIHLMQKVERGANRITDHPVSMLLRYSPNEESTISDVISALFYQVLTYGNGYLRVHRRSGVVRFVEVLFDHQVSIQRGSRGLEYVVSVGDSREPVRVPARDMVHIRGLTAEGVIGLRPHEKNKQTIGWAAALQRYSSRFFKNGAEVRGLLSAPGKVSDPAKMKDAWQSTYGASGSHGTAVLENGMTYERIGIPPEDAQFLETKRLAREEIAALFKVPQHLVGILDHATFSNIEHMNIQYVQHTLLPWVRKLEQELTRKLLTDSEVRDKGFCVRVNVAGLLRGDMTTRTSFYQTGIQSGYLTRNEVREMEDLNPLEGLDEPLVPLNMVGESESESENDNDKQPDERMLSLLSAASGRYCRRLIKEIEQRGSDDGFIERQERIFREMFGFEAPKGVIGELISATDLPENGNDYLMMRLSNEERNA